MTKLNKKLENSAQATFQGGQIGATIGGSSVAAICAVGGSFFGPVGTCFGFQFGAAAGAAVGGALGSVTGLVLSIDAD